MPRPAQDRTPRPDHRSPRQRGRSAIAIAVLAAALLLVGCDGTTSATPSSTTPSPPATTVAVGDPSTTADGGVDDPEATTVPDEPEGPGDPGDPGDPASTDPAPPLPGVVTGGTTVSQASNPRSGASVNDVRDIDFAEHTFPSTACAGVIDHPPTEGYALVGGEVRWGDPVDGSYGVALDPDRSYGDVNDDGVRDVSLVLECTRGGRPIPVGWVYTVDAGRAVALAEVDLDPDSLPVSGVLDTELADIHIRGADITTEWVVYLDGDAVCCPTTTATVAWTWNGHELIPGTPAVHRKPVDR